MSNVKNELETQTFDKWYLIPYARHFLSLSHAYVVSSSHLLTLKGRKTQHFFFKIKVIHIGNIFSGGCKDWSSTCCIWIKNTKYNKRLQHLCQTSVKSNPTVADAWAQMASAWAENDLARNVYETKSLRAQKFQLSDKFPFWIVSIFEWS